MVLVRFMSLVFLRRKARLWLPGFLVISGALPTSGLLRLLGPLLSFGFLLLLGTLVAKTRSMKNGLLANFGTLAVIGFLR